MSKSIDAWLLFSKYSINIKEKSGYLKRLIDKAKENNINLEIKNIHSFSILSKDGNKLFYEGKEVKKLPKIAIIRRYEIYLTRQLELMGVTVLNSSSSMCDARNKMKIHQLLSNNHISTPATVFTCFKNDYSNITYENTSKILKNKTFVLKWLYGSQGKHVYIINNKEEFDNLIKKYKGKVLCQEYIKESFGMDIRAYVINGKFFKAAIRRSNGKDFRSNLAQGGEAEVVSINDKIISLAENAAKACNLDICGVDILVGKNNYYVCEVNANPGFKSIGKIYNTDEIDIFIDLIKDKLNK